jgi:hypothetical protein
MLSKSAGACDQIFASPPDTVMAIRARYTIADSTYRDERVGGEVCALLYGVDKRGIAR